MFGQWDVLVPRRHDREARRAAPDRDLALPLIQKALDEGEALPSAGIAEAAHALDQRRFERCAVPPAVAEPLGVGALERASEADAPTSEAAAGADPPHRATGRSREQRGRS